VRVYLPRLSTGPWVDQYVDELERLASLDRFRAHELVDDPDLADVVLFVQCHMVDWRLSAIRRHPVARAYWDKVMVFDERDRPWTSFPGVYVSTPAPTFDQCRQRSWGYLRVPHSPLPPAEPDLLFSFIGSRTAPCRDALFDLRHREGVVEEVSGFMFWDHEAQGFEKRRRQFVQTLARSRFVLCPRGRGTSSIRLYETIAAGRVPVIISDEWVEPPGPNWKAFTLRIAESRAKAVLELLESHRDDWQRMSAEASAAYRDFFSDEVVFHRIAELLRELVVSEAPRSSQRELGSRSIVSALQDALRRRVAREE
jgi:glycosyltransferase involved in cell wall biosynthesis